MPILTIDGKQYEVDAGKRLVLAIEDSGIDILHRCGGFARCTTCRVEITEGEPDRMTVAEKNKLTDQGNLGKFRLSCQSTCDHDMTLTPLMTLQNTDVDGPGNRPQDNITPEPEWTTKP